MDYQSSGVSIDAGNEVVRRIRSLAKGTFTPALVNPNGSFSATIAATLRDKLIVTIGLDDVVVVDAGDVFLVCKTDQAQKVKDVVEHLRKHNQERYL